MHFLLNCIHELRYYRRILCSSNLKALKGRSSASDGWQPIDWHGFTLTTNKDPSPPGKKTKVFLPGGDGLNHKNLSIMRMTRGFAALHPGLTDPTLPGLSSYTSINCHTQYFINSPSPSGTAFQIDLHQKPKTRPESQRDGISDRPTPRHAKHAPSPRRDGISHSQTD